MAIKEIILELGEKTSDPSVTISYNTHRTHPENEQDRVVLKNLLSEAQERLMSNYKQSDISELLKKISRISDEIDNEHNLESMHIFLSNDSQKIVKTTWPVPQNAAFISEKFALRGLIEADSRSKEYLVLLLSQGGAILYEALNDSVVNEVKDGGFAFPETPYLTENNEQASDAEKKDNLVREYLNVIDKALLQVCRKTDLKCVVVCLEDTYSKLMQITDDSGIYLGHVAIDYNKSEPHEIVMQSYELIQGIQTIERKELLEEIEIAVSSDKVISDLQEIFQAAIDGRGELLIVNQDFVQAVKMTSDRTFEISDDTQGRELIGDIVNAITFEILKNKGRVAFATAKELSSHGDIVLKTRY